MKQLISGLGVEAQREIIPVSYTHLDVYKRQDNDTNDRLMDSSYHDSERIEALYYSCNMFQPSCLEYNLSLIHISPTGRESTLVQVNTYLLPIGTKRSKL